MARVSHTTGTQPFREEFRLRKLGFEYDDPKHFYSCQVSLPFTFTFLLYCSNCNGKNIFLNIYIYTHTQKKEKRKEKEIIKKKKTAVNFNHLIHLLILLFMNDTSNMYSRKMNH